MIGGYKEYHVKKTSIIIPTYNAKELLVQCVKAVIRYTNVPYEIIVIDNGSTDGTVEFCLLHQIKVVYLPQNSGFPIASNFGLLMAEGDAIVLLNNDVIVSENWLSNMLKVLYSNSNIGIVGPKTNRTNGKQKARVKYAGINQFHAISKKWNIYNRAKWKSVHRIVGLCFLFKRELLERVGFLDERFSPGYYEDDDYCYRARKAGYKLMISGDVLVHHYGSLSFRKKGRLQKRALLRRNRNIFIEKWGVDPHLYI